MYTTLLQTVLNLSLHEASKIAQEMLSQVYEEVRLEGTAKLPENFGDKLNVKVHN